MRVDNFRSWMAAGAFIAGIAIAGAPARAAIVIVNSVQGGGAIGPGATYANFNNLPTGTTGGLSGGITVSFTDGGGATGQAVQGDLSGEYARPDLSGNNGVGFGGGLLTGFGSGNQANGDDATTYLTSGVSSDGGQTGGSVTLAFGAAQKYLGILWGSVDGYNTLSFFQGSTLVGSFTGGQVMTNPDGSQDVAGTRYVNFSTTGGDTFNRVVATSTSYAFEFDNVAYGVTAVPEPGTAVMGLTAAGLGGLVALRRRMKKAPVTA